MSATAGNILAGSAVVRLGLDDNIQGGLRRASMQLKAFGTAVKDIGRGIMTAGAGIAVPFGLATKTFMTFEDQMAIVRSVTSSTGKDFDALTAKARELGKTTSFTAIEVAQGMTELGRAGLTTEQIMKTIGVTLNTARAGAIDLGQASTVIVDLLNAFKLTADEAERVGDVIAKTANISTTDIAQISEAMRYVASSASITGHSLEEVSGALAVLANRSLKGEMAGASLAMVLSQLSMEDVAKEFHDMEISLDNTDGTMRSITDLMTDLNKETAKMTPVEKLGLFTKLFTERGKRSAIILSENVQELAKMRTVMENVNGDMARMARIMDDTSGGSFRRLWGAITDVQIAFGGATKELVQSWLESIRNAAIVVANMITVYKGLIVASIKAIAIIIASGVAFYTLGTAIRVAAAAMALFRAACIAASTGFAGLFTSIKSFNAIIASVLPQFISLMTQIRNSRTIMQAHILAWDTVNYSTKRGVQYWKAFVVALASWNARSLLGSVKALSGSVLSWISNVRSAITITRIYSVAIGLVSQAGKSFLALLGPIATAVGVAFSGYSLGKFLSKLTGINRALEDFFKLIYNAQEVSIEDTFNVSIQQLDRQLKEQIISEKEYNKRLGVVLRERKKLELKNQFERGELTQEEYDIALADVRDKSLDTKGKTPAPITKSEDTLKFEKSIQDRIRKYQIERIVDTEQREIESIKNKYAVDYEEAKKLGADISLLKRAEQAEIDAVREKSLEKQNEAETESIRSMRDLRNSLIENQYEREKAIINAKYDDEIEAAGRSSEIISRLNEMRNMELMNAEKQRSASERDKIYEIAELKLESEYKGVELEQQKLALAEQRALLEAQISGNSTDLVKKEYELRRKILGLSGQRFDVAGTFSAAAANMIGQGASSEEARTAKATEESAKLLKRIESKIGQTAIVS